VLSGAFKTGKQQRIHFTGRKNFFPVRGMRRNIWGFCMLSEVRRRNGAIQRENSQYLLDSLKKAERA
jgi:hypothetical protein